MQPTRSQADVMSGAYTVLKLVSAAFHIRFKKAIARLLHLW